MKKITIRMRAYIALSLLAVLLTLLYITYNELNPNSRIKFLSEVPKEIDFGHLIIYLSGEVTNPGTYELAIGSRVSEAIEFAGGFSPNADLTYINKELNLAEVLEDEQHIFIPAKDLGTTPEITIDTNTININTSSITQLDSLPGIGPSSAQKIIDNRPYSQISDLLDVPGIGQAKFDEIKDLVSI